MRQSNENKLERKWRLRSHRGKYVVVWDRGKGKSPARISTGTDDKGTAEARASRIWQAHHKPQSGRLNELWPLYVDSRNLEIAAPKQLEFAWRILQPHFGYKLAQSITRDDCREYYRIRKLRDISNSTIRTELAYLRACLNFHSIASANTVWLPPPAKPRHHWLSKEQVLQILSATDTPHINLFITLAVTTAARMSAILDLTWDRVDFANRTIDYIPPGRYKTNKGRTIVPINERAYEALQSAYQARLTDNVIEYNGKAVASVKKAVQRAGDRVGLHCSSHVFRHTAGVWMAQANVPMEKISQYMGHTTVIITERHYARFSPSYMQDASEALNW